jgi:hypothetical protein
MINVLTFWVDIYDIKVCVWMVFIQMPKNAKSQYRIFDLKSGVLNLF